MKKTAEGKAVARNQAGTTSEKGDKPAAPSSMWVVREIADTTWRMTIPVVIFAFIGIFSDIKLGSKPWLTLLGVVVGFYFAALLVKKQIDRSKDI